MRKDDILYYLLGVLLFVIVGIIKNSGHQTTMIMLFFVFPGLLVFKEMEGSGDLRLLPNSHSRRSSPENAPPKYDPGVMREPNY